MRLVKHRTKKMISDALLSLLITDKRDFDTITVNEICTRAMIHRTTFYSHFEDKFALFQYTFHSLSYERIKFPVKERVFQPFMLSEMLQQIQPLRLASHLYQTSDILKPVIEQLMTETIQQDLSELEQQYFITNSKFPISLRIKQICTTLVTLDLFWDNDPNEYSAQDIDSLYQQLIEPIIPIKIASY